MCAMYFLLRTHERTRAFSLARARGSRLLIALSLSFPVVAAVVQCNIFADNVLQYVYVDGTLLHENDVDGEHDAYDAGSHDGEILSLSFPSTSNSIVIKAWDWEQGCGNGGVNIECWSSTGNTVWDQIDIGESSTGADIPNWRVYSADSYPFDAPSGMTDADFDTSGFNQASASSHRNALCAESRYWVFRRDFSTRAGTSPALSLSFVFSLTSLTSHVSVSVRPSTDYSIPPSLSLSFLLPPLPPLFPLSPSPFSFSLSLYLSRLGRT